MKNILMLLGGYFLLTKFSSYAVDKVKNNIKYNVLKTKAAFSPTDAKLVNIRTIIMIENNNPFPLDFKDFFGSIWYGDIIFNSEGKPTNQAGIKIADIQINDFQQIAPNSVGSINLDFTINISDTIQQAVNQVAAGALGITTVVKLYGEIGLFSTQYTGVVKYPIIIPINLLGE